MDELSQMALFLFQSLTPEAKNEILALATALKELAKRADTTTQTVNDERGVLDG